MKKFFEEYGQVIIVLIVVAVLLLILGTSQKTGLAGKVYDMLGEQTDSFNDALTTLTNTVAGKKTLTIEADKYTVSNETGEFTGKQLFGIDLNESTDITYTGDENFIFWVDDNLHVVGTENNRKCTYVATDRESSHLNGYAIKDEEVAVVFWNDYKQVLGCWKVSKKAVEYCKHDDSSSFSTNEELFDDGPAKVGYTFAGWSYNNETYTTEKDLLNAIRTDIQSNLGKTIDLKPTNIKNDQAVKVNVKMNGTIKETKTVTLGNSVVLNASDYLPEGKKFAGWKIGDSVVSYSEGYTFIPAQEKEYTVELVYSDAEVEKNASIMITDTSATLNESTSRYTHKMTSRYYVPEGYTVTGTGIYYSNNSDDLSDENIASHTHVYESLLTTSSGTITLTLTAKASTLYGRAYVSYTDKSGASHKVYSKVASTMDES